MILDTPDRNSTRSSEHSGMGQGPAVLRVLLFFCVTGAALFALDAGITAGLRRMDTSIYGVNNRIMRGDIDAQILITGSSRAASHYDPRVISEITGRSAYNLGRNGSQTDMQLAVLKTYLKHNRRPALIVHNLDAFSFQTSHEVYNQAQYVPYLYEEELYQPLRAINPNIWKSRYLPLYGYVVEDMSFAWLQGLRSFLPGRPKETLFDGYDPRSAPWTDEFDRFKADNPQGVRWEIEHKGVALMEELVRISRDNGVPLLLVYSPEFRGMQELTLNRAEIFAKFSALATHPGVMLWDYSNWADSGNTMYFTNSQHLNATGAERFSRTFAQALRTDFAWAGERSQ